MSRGSRGNYWSGSKLAKWIQYRFANVVKPHALPLGGWRDWDNQLKSQHPFVFWLTEVVFDKLQHIINSPTDVLSEIRYWGYNRFVHQPHLIKTRLKPGQYYEIDTRILHGLFEMFVDFIEVEKAWMHVVWNEDARAQHNLPWYKRVPYWLRWKEWRCPEAGLDHLRWEMSLVNDYEWLPEEERASREGFGVPTPQATCAKEQYELYNWWKNIRPTRPDAMDISGWTKYCDDMDQKYGPGLFHDNTTEEEQQQSRDALDASDRIEATYETEDEKMLIRLIKIRRGLWT